MASQTSAALTSARGRAEGSVRALLPLPRSWVSFDYETLTKEASTAREQFKSAIDTVARTRLSSELNDPRTLFRMLSAMEEYIALLNAQSSNYYVSYELQEETRKWNEMYQDAAELAQRLLGAPRPVQLDGALLYALEVERVADQSALTAAPGTASLHRTAAWRATQTRIVDHFFNPIKYPTQYKLERFFTLYGGPGVGKTLHAQTAAREIANRLLSTDLPTFNWKKYVDLATDEVDFLAQKLGLDVKDYMTKLGDLLTARTAARLAESTAANAAKSSSPSATKTSSAQAVTKARALEALRSRAADIAWTALRQQVTDKDQLEDRERLNSLTLYVAQRKDYQKTNKVPVPGTTMGGISFPGRDDLVQLTVGDCVEARSRLGDAATIEDKIELLRVWIQSVRVSAGSNRARLATLESGRRRRQAMLVIDNLDDWFTPSSERAEPLAVSGTMRQVTADVERVQQLVEEPSPLEGVSTSSPPVSLASAASSGAAVVSAATGPGPLTPPPNRAVKPVPPPLPAPPSRSVFGRAADLAASAVGAGLDLVEGLPLVGPLAEAARGAIAPKKGGVFGDGSDNERLAVALKSFFETETHDVWIIFTLRQPWRIPAVLLNSSVLRHKEHVDLPDNELRENVVRQYLVHMMARDWANRAYHQCTKKAAANSATVSTTAPAASSARKTDSEVILDILSDFYQTNYGSDRPDKIETMRIELLRVLAPKQSSSGSGSASTSSAANSDLRSRLVSWKQQTLDEVAPMRMSMVAATGMSQVAACRLKMSGVPDNILDGWLRATDRMRYLAYGQFDFGLNVHELYEFLHEVASECQMRKKKEYWALPENNRFLVNSSDPTQRSESCRQSQLDSMYRDTSSAAAVTSAAFTPTNAEECQGPIEPHDLDPFTFNCHYDWTSADIQRAVARFVRRGAATPKNEYVSHLRWKLLGDPRPNVAYASDGSSCAKLVEEWGTHVRDEAARDDPDREATAQTWRPPLFTTAASSPTPVPPNAVSAASPYAGSYPPPPASRGGRAAAAPSRSPPPPPAPQTLPLPYAAPAVQPAPPLAQPTYPQQGFVAAPAVAIGSQPQQYSFPPLPQTLSPPSQQPPGLSAWMQPRGPLGEAKSLVYVGGGAHSTMERHRGGSHHIRDLSRINKPLFRS